MKIFFSIFFLSSLAYSVAPVATDPVFGSGKEGGTITTTLEASDSDGGTITFSIPLDQEPDNMTGTYTIGLTSQAEGVFTAVVTYTHDGSETTSDSFKYKANDGSGASGDSNLATASITITPVNDEPVLDAISDPSAILEDAGSQTINLTGIGDGDAGVTQAISSVSAISNNTNLIPHPTVTYTSDNATGSLAYTPVSNANGSAVITVTVTDNGGTANSGVESTTRTFTVAVTAVNDAPVIDAISDPSAILEDAGSQTINLTGIGDGDAEVTQTITSVTATSSNTSLIPNPTVTYTPSGATGSLAYTPVSNINGSAVITVTVTDNGGTANSGVESTTRTFTVAVTAVNDEPSFTKGADITVLEDSGTTTHATWATSISEGPSNESSQKITFNVSNDNTSLFTSGSQPAISSTGTLTFTPAANANGSATVTVNVSDDGGIANSGDDTSPNQTFTITVTAVNDAPVIDAISDPSAILEDAGSQTINLTGIGDGDAEVAQTIAVTATSSNTNLIPNPTRTYTSDNATGSLAYTPVSNANGSAVITVTVTDNGGTANSGVESTTRTFTVAVTAVNDAPVIDAISDPSAILEDAGSQTINLTGIGDGDAEVTQTITSVTATSSNTSLIPNPTVTYTPSGATGSLAYTPISNINGSAVITVTVTDNGGTANSGVESTTRTFTVAVTAVNDEPSFTKGADITVLEDSGTTTHATWATSISEGPSNESSQNITFNVSNNLNSLFSSQPAISSTGTLTFTPDANINGSATVTVNVSDDGGTANSGDNTSLNQTFTITVTAVNDAPVIDAISDPSAILEDAGSQTINLTGIGDGDAEVNQTIAVTATSSNTSLIPNPTRTYTSDNATGSLAYTPVSNINGSAVITVTVTDNGGTANSGVESTTRTFTVAVTAVNDEPSFTKGADITVLEDSGTTTHATWATSISEGPSNESSQNITFNVSNNLNSLFSSQPAISSTGTLTFTPDANINGSATVTVNVSDDGGTANSGDNTSPNQTFTITVTPVIIEDVILSFSDATSSSVNIMYESNVEIAAFQFDVEGTGITIENIYGGVAAANDFNIQYLSTDSITRVLAFSFSGDTIPAGSGILLSLDFFEVDEGGATLEVSDVVIAGPGGNLVTSSGPGSIDLGNFEPFIFNNSSLQAFYYFQSVNINTFAVAPDDWVGAFNGDVCVGARKWDISQCGGGVCEVPIMGYYSTLPEQTAGYMTSGAVPTFKIYDASENAYYAAIPSEDIPWFNLGTNILDELSASGVTILGCMDDGSSNNYPYPGIEACNYDYMATVEDASCDYSCIGCMDIEACNYNSSFIVDCGDCCVDPPINYDCAGNCTNLDCAGVCGGNTGIDECGVCGGDNSTCTDCLGAVNGDALYDNCGYLCVVNTPTDDCSIYCDNDPSNDCTQDCAGTWGGTAVVDNCGVCDNNLDNDCIDYSLELNAGFNLISFYALPEDNSVNNVLSSLGDNAASILGEGAAATNTDNGWLGSLASILYEDGYWLYVNETDTLNLIGVPVSSDQLYTLHKGYNLISYPFLECGDIEEVLTDDIEDCIYAIIGEGFAIMNTEDGWVGSRSTLCPNNGYWFTNQCNDLSFTFEEPTSLARSQILSPSPYPYNQSSQQAFYFIESVENIELGDWILAYNGNIVIGARQWTGGIIDVPAMGDAGSSLTEGYIQPGSIPQFKLLKGDKLIELTGEVPVWSENQIYMVSSLTPLPESFNLSAAYPNPFNPTTTLNFALPVDSKVSLSIYDLQGRKVSQLISGNMDAGYHSVVWNADRHSSGVYFVKMVSGEYVKTQKLMLVK